MLNNDVNMANFTHHLATLTSNNWNKLFNLLPILETANKFGELKGGEKLADGSFTFPYWVSSVIVDKTIDVIIELKLSPVFDWMNWEERQIILDDETLDYKTLDAITLCKLFTVIIRLNRFNEGYLIKNFENGIMTKIIKALQIKYQASSIDENYN